MDYEKKYKEALELARKLYNMRGDWTNLEIESIFPELAESEDERIRKALICFLDAEIPQCEARDKYIDWLEKQGEQKPAEWSKEDKRDFDVIYGIIYNSCNAEDASRLIAWLKSLKDRYIWKPSDEQIEALEHFVRSVGESGYASPYDNNTKLLYSLLEQLKKHYL